MTTIPLSYTIAKCFCMFTSHSKNHDISNKTLLGIKTIGLSKSFKVQLNGNGRMSDVEHLSSLKTKFITY